MTPLLPGAPGADGAPLMLGVMGGGQLARLFVHAAQAMGYRTAVLDPDPESPAGRIAHRHLRHAYDDPAGLAALTQACAAVTTEFENVPARALAELARHRPVAPAAEAVAVCQDRAAEKAHFGRCGVPCAPHARIASAADVAGVDDGLFPAILKTARLGYDGKGQVAVTSRERLAGAWRELREVPCVLEQRLPLAAELSVVLARGADGATVALPVQQNRHRDGILALTIAGAPAIAEATRQQALAQAATLAASLGYVGVLCVEFFVLADGRLVANEMAPRPHNSGHHSIDSCDLSQFELQVRALAGLPLVTPRPHSAAVMLNLLGDLWFDAGAAAPRTPDWSRVLALPGAHLHLYGKLEPRPGRKMGHLTVTAADPADALRTAREAAARLGLPAF
jgi:5-(carboxyamino)imidazole ribonucleotide synthase